MLSPVSKFRAGIVITAISVCMVFALSSLVAPKSSSTSSQAQNVVSDTSSVEGRSNDSYAFEDAPHATQPVVGSTEIKAPDQTMEAPEVSDDALLAEADALIEQIDAEIAGTINPVPNSGGGTSQMAQRRETLRSEAASLLEEMDALRNELR